MELDVPETVNDMVDRELRSKERVWKTRKSIMEALAKDFSSVIQVLQRIKVSNFLYSLFFFALGVFGCPIFVCILEVAF